MDIKRVAATVMFDEDSDKIYIVADSIDENGWLPQISLHDAIAKGQSWEFIEQAGDNDD